MCSSQTSMSKLQGVQNAAMRIVTGAAKPTSCSALRFWLGLNSITERQKILAAQAFLGALTTASHPLHDELKERKDELVNQRLKTVRSWVKDAREIVETVCTPENIKQIEWIDSTKEIPVQTARITCR